MRNLSLRFLTVLTLLVSSVAAQAEVNEAVQTRRFETIINQQNAMEWNPGAARLATAAASAVGQVAAGNVTLALADFTSLWDELRKQRKAGARRHGPAIVMGSAFYDARAIPGALSIDVELHVTLSREGQWKLVPIAGADTVIRSARVDGEPIPVAVRDGYHVWATRRTGEIRVDLTLLVAARGPRGSVEYDFSSARTPVTEFRCRFPREGLEPRVDSAIQADVTSRDGETILVANLRPTARIHMVGFHDMGAAEEQEAKVYVESLHLLSLDEGKLDLFTELRYTILYAGRKHFEVALPEDVQLVSADGEGAFRFSIEERDGGRVLRGETAYPIRNSYAISLHLRRTADKGGEELDVPIPHTLATEREVGWLAIEVPGKLRLRELAPGQAMRVDVRQLPAAVVQSAVSPILQAYRFDAAAPGIRLATERLPEVHPASGSIDNVRAFTVVAEDGSALTELRITLRNRLRHSLAMTLPTGYALRSALLDTQPVTAGRDEAGRVILPLKRSAGRDRLESFTLQVVLEGTREPLSLMGSEGGSAPEPRSPRLVPRLVGLPAGRARLLPAPGRRGLPAAARAGRLAPAPEPRRSRGRPRQPGERRRGAVVGARRQRRDRRHARPHPGPEGRHPPRVRPLLDRRRGPGGRPLPPPPQLAPWGLSPSCSSPCSSSQRCSSSPVRVSDVPGDARSAPRCSPPPASPRCGSRASS